MLSLLFDQRRDMLGEIVTEHGSLRRMMLTALGEGRVGVLFDWWQTNGVPYRRALPDVGQGEVVFFLERVTPQSIEFHDAVQAWAVEQQYPMIDLMDAAVDVWQRVVSLPLSLEERFAFLLGLKHTSPAFLPQWRHALDEALDLMQRERASTEKAVERLKKQLAPQLAKPFTTAGSK